MQLDEQYTDTAYLNTVEGMKKNIWEIEIAVNDKIIRFKIDTGAEMTVLSENTWKVLNLPEPLQNTCTSLCVPDHTALKVLGKVLVTLRHKARYYTQPVYVVKNVKNNLLRLPAIKALNM